MAATEPGVEDGGRAQDAERVSSPAPEPPAPESPAPDPHEDAPSLNERLLDVLVYAPAGLLATVLEEFPALVARGRAQMSGKVGSAKAVGQFAVATGSRELRRRASDLAGHTGLDTTSPAARSRTVHGGPDTAAAGGGPAPTTPGSTARPGGSRAPSRASAGRPTRPRDPQAQDALQVEAVPEARGTAPTAPTAPTAQTPPVARDGTEVAAPDVKAEASSLAIPGFDSLSASQVVQRLDGLTRDELRAVRAYESAHRGRRTILSRVDQLFDERI